MSRFKTEISCSIYVTQARFAHCFASRLQRKTRSLVVERLPPNLHNNGLAHKRSGKNNERQTVRHSFLCSGWFFMGKRIFLSLVLTAIVLIGAVWVLFRFGGLRLQHFTASSVAQGSINSLSAPSWAEAVEKVKADRGDMVGGAIEIPPELKHYADRHWFLATQVAEVEEHKVQTCQDYVDLASMIERGEMVSVPDVTNTYVLYGVGAKADDSAFTRYEDGETIGLYTEPELSDAYRKLADKRLQIQSEIASLKGQASSLKKGERAKQKELQKQISGRQQDLKSTDEEKTKLDRFYGRPETRQQLLRDYQSLQKLAQNFGGRSYDLGNSADRQALKVKMLSSLRPEAVKTLEQVASAYHSQFERPLPISSLVRPEQYQRALSRVNRNAVLIETPPHSTGLAFDIDYRYMSAPEQTFVMAELARLKREGRIEVIRERNANYHVFAFLNGARPSDELITASLDKASAPVPESNHASAKPAKPAGKAQKAKAQKTKARSSKPTARTRKHRRR